jgi:hypothetical protein
LKTTFYRNLKAFTLCAGFFSLAACKEKSAVKPDLIPGVDNIHTFEVTDFNMSVKNAYNDSLWTSDYTYPFVTIGRINNDPFFGKTAAGVYFQVVPPASGFTFPAGVIIDSSVLSIPYLDFAYGDTSHNDPGHAFNLKVYQITEPFSVGDRSRKYFAFDRVTYNAAAPIGSGIFSIKSLRDTVKLGTGDSIGRMLRVKLSNDFNAAFAATDPANFATSTAFMDYFKGIFIGPDTTAVQNTLGAFTLYSGSLVSTYANAQLEFYYHAGSDTAKKKAYFRFDPTICNFYNSIYRNYTGVAAAGYRNNQNADRDSLVLQGYPGFRSDVTIQIDTAVLPYSVINKAELKITVLKTGDDNRFTPPPQLIIRGFKADGTERAVADILNGDDSTTNSSGAAFVGGLATSVQIGAVQYIQYKLNIPRELQRIMSEGRQELKLRLFVPTARQGMHRLIADGPNSSNADTKLRFNVIYTKLN